MNRVFALLATAALLSCQSSDPVSSVAPQETGGVALRLQSASELRPTDSVKVVLSYKQGLATVTASDSVPWSRNGVKLTDLPLETPIRVRMEAWESERGRRLVYWTAETTTTLSKDSPAWDFTKGVQNVPLRVVPMDSTGYVAPVLNQVAVVSRGEIKDGLLRLEAVAGRVDSVLFDTLKVDSVYIRGVAVEPQAGMFRVRLPEADTLDNVVVVGHNGLTSSLRIEVATAEAPVQVAGLGAHWSTPTPVDDDWVGWFVPLAVEVDSGTVDSIVVRFEGSPSLHFQRDPEEPKRWTTQWEPAPGSTEGILKAFAVGGGKELPLPERSLHVDHAKPDIQPLTFRKDSVFRVGTEGRDLLFNVLDANAGGLVVWGVRDGKADSTAAERATDGYVIRAFSSLTIHARDRFGNEAELPVKVVLDTTGPVLTRLKGPNGEVLQPGSGAVETTTGEVSLTVDALTDSIGVGEVWAMLDTNRVSWDRQTHTLKLGMVGTWIIHANDLLGNTSTWGTVVVRYPAPAKPKAPTVTPASGVYGADSLKWGAVADTLVPVVTCTEGSPQIQVDGKPWRAFVEGKEFFALAGGEAKATYRCKTASDSSDPVARTWVMLHEPFLTNGGVFYDSIEIRRARNGILPNGSSSGNPVGATLELCASDSTTCAVPGTIWTPMEDGTTILKTTQALSARLMMLDAQSGMKIYSRVLTRVYQRLSPTREDWSPTFTKNADAAGLKSRFGVVDSGTTTTVRTLKTTDSILELTVTWGTPSGTPYAWVDIPLEADGHPWNLVDVTSFDLEVSGTGVKELSIQVLSDVYDTADVRNGRMFSATLPAPGPVAKWVSAVPTDFALPGWAVDNMIKPVDFNAAVQRASGLRVVAAGPENGTGVGVLHLHKIVVKGTATRVAK